MNLHPSFMIPDWTSPSNVRAVVTLRQGGQSTSAYRGFNLAVHVGDREQAVAANRRLLVEQLQLGKEPCWLDQVHGNTVVEESVQLQPKADGVFTRQAGHPIAIMVADCVPILMCDTKGTCIGAVHAGWKGLAAGVIKSLVNRMGDHSELMAWLGPAIGPCHYEVGSEVMDCFGVGSGLSVKKVQKSSWRMDMWETARQQLKQLNVREVYGGGICTYCHGRHFYSYRRDGVTGRNAAIIWLEQ